MLTQYQNINDFMRPVFPVRWCHINQEIKDVVGKDLGDLCKKMAIINRIYIQNIIVIDCTQIVGTYF